MTLRFLGVDVGLNTTAWCLALCFNGRRFRKATGEIHSPPGLDYHARLRFQVRAFGLILQQLEPNVAAVEQYRYFGKKSHSPAAFYLSQLVGRLEGRIEGAGIELVEDIDKSTANRSLGLLGKVSKKRVGLAIAAALPPASGAEPAESLSEHENDSALVLIAAHQRYTSPLYRRLS